MSQLKDIEIIDSQGRYHVPDPEILELAERILYLFVEMRRIYVPGRVRITKKHHMKFYEAARLCRLRQMTPEEFVKTQLEGMARDGHFWPNRIASTNLLEKAQGGTGDSKRTHQLDRVNFVRYYKSQLLCFRHMAKIYGEWETLHSPTFQLTPLFRAVVAHKLGFSDLVRELKRDARLELESSSHTREIFAGELEFLDE